MCKLTDQRSEKSCALFVVFTANVVFEMIFWLPCVEATQIPADDLKEEYQNQNMPIALPSYSKPKDQSTRFNKRDHINRLMRKRQRCKIKCSISLYYHSFELSIIHSFETGKYCSTKLHYKHT